MQFITNVSRSFEAITPEKASSPQGYKRLYGFHKYWGKKPHEPLAFAIEQLTEEGDTVLDPFVGSGTTARESLVRNRRFIGFDINPIAIELTKLLISPPEYDRILEAYQIVKESVRDKISSSYRLSDGRIASHYLWGNGNLTQVWLRGNRGSAREELTPSAQDLSLIEEYASYESSHIPAPRFFSNGRINSHPRLSLSSILTGRAQRNLDLLIACIEGLPLDIRNSMKLCLTSASGQMTKMVFAITNRGKTIGQPASRIEVGSWVIGYWRPRLHFEINVWNCFESRVSKLLNAVKTPDPLQGLRFCNEMESFAQGDSPCYVSCEPCQTGMRRIKEKSVNLILTDPPHSDRIPYLELSELWNSILGIPARFDSEIVVSNARERGKTLDEYDNSMHKVVSSLSHVMRDDAFLLLLYNARQEARWTFISEIAERSNGLNYLGKFPCNYSAGSVVQDNRRGGLKGDVALVFGKPRADAFKLRRLARILDWSTDAPNE